MITWEQLMKKGVKGLKIEYISVTDPHYVDVIIQRWEQFTGEKATLLD